MRRASDNLTRPRILQYIKDFIVKKGYAPTIRDIMRGCSLSSTAVVQHHLNTLEKEGSIHRDPEIFRSIQLTGKDSLTVVPLLGVIAAGEPIPVPTADAWTNDAWETIEVPRKLTHGKNVFALRVKGHSMIDALIDDGDIVLMQQTQSADNGEMVAVWLKDRKEVTLKKIFFENQMVRLQPANSKMKPILVEPDTVEIQGKVISVIRKLL